MTTAAQGSWVERIAKLQDSEDTTRSCTGRAASRTTSNLVRQNPRVTRTAFQRIYDMILSHGKTEYIDNKKKLIRYHFFSDEQFGGRDAIFGLDVPLMKLVNVFKSAAQRLRHREARHPAPRAGGLVASRTIARLLKKGMEEYSQDARGRLLHLRLEPREEGQPTARCHKEQMKCPMNEEPLNLIPREWRAEGLRRAAATASGFAIPERQRAVPRLPLRLQGADDGVRAATSAEGDPAHPGATG